MTNPPFPLPLTTDGSYLFTGSGWYLGSIINSEQAAALVDMVNEHPKLVAQVQLMSGDREEYQDRLTRSQEWYSVRWQRMKEWARTESPKEFSDQFFNILANETRDVHEPPTYTRQLVGLKHRINELESANADLQRQVAELTIQVHGQPGKLRK